MAVATRSRRSLITRWLREDYVSNGKSRVDRSSGIIRGVKVAGLTSDNGRQYLLEAYRDALHLYEGAPVFCDHPSGKSEQRQVDRRLGTIRNPRLGSDGVYGDLHLLRSHPMTRRLMEAAESMPDAFGLSHNAQGKGETEGGVFVVHEIVEVRSVDLVAEPATTKGLFESREDPSMPDPMYDDPEKQPLPEQDPMEEPAPAPDAAAPNGDGVKAAIKAEINKILDSDADAQTMLSQIREWLKIHEKSQAIGQEPAAVEEDEEPEDEEETKESRRHRKGARGTLPLQEQLELQRLRREKRARQLCESQGIRNPPDLLIAALTNTDSEKQQLAYIREHKTTARPAQRVRSQGPSTALSESRSDYAKMSDEETVALLRS